MKRLRNILALLICISLATYAYAVTTGITITFVIPTTYSHSISTQTPCTITDFACKESDGTYEGTQNNINITQIDGTSCQTSTNPAIVITNNGNSPTNVSINASTAMPTGVELKAMNTSTSWLNDCNMTATSYWDATGIGCKNVTNTENTLLALDLAKDGTESIWMACDFTSFNSGAATSTVTRVLNLTNNP